jgi:tetratricopeptide (TPR) repeat protein
MNFSRKQKEESQIILQQAEEWNEKGVYMAGSGRFTNALECFNRSLDILPRYEPALTNKGGILTNLLKFNEAMKCYDQVIKAGFC